MTTAELTDWLAFERVYGPILIHDRVEVMLAQVCALLASAFGKRAHEPAEFMPRWDTGREQPVEERVALFKRALGAA